MQEEALKLVLLALEDGSALSRKVLVLFVVQRLEPRFPQASKTSIGHVVQLLYRASCFKVLIWLKTRRNLFYYFDIFYKCYLIFVLLNIGATLSVQNFLLYVCKNFFQKIKVTSSFCGFLLGYQTWWRFIPNAAERGVSYLRGSATGARLSNCSDCYGGWIADCSWPVVFSFVWGSVSQVTHAVYYR